MNATQQLILSSWLIASADQAPLPGGALLIEGGRIAAVGPGDALRARHPGAAVVDLRGKAVSPGFVDAHRHCYGVLAHGIPAGQAPADFWSFLADYWWPRVEDRLDHAMLRAAMDLACHDMIDSGVTTFFDCLEAPNALPDGLFAQSEVVSRWGLRGMLCFEATERAGAGNGELGLRENAAFIDACRARPGGGGTPLLLGAMCHHTTFTCGDGFIRRAHALARERAALLHFHCAEGTSQCVQLSPREVAIAGEHGLKVTTMPLSNCEVGGGIAPVPELQRAGATVGLGTDGYVANFFATLRGAFLIHKARLLDPAAMPGRVVWRMATLDGARAMGLPDVGTLAPGASADLVAIDLDLPTPVTADNLFDQLILWRDAARVDSVMCAGRWLKRDHAVLGADPAALLARTREAAARLWA